MESRETVKKERKGYIMAPCDDSSENAFYSISVISKNSPYATIKYSSNTLEEIPLSELIPFDPISESGTSDLSKILQVNDASLLINLLSCYNTKKIFSRLENLTISINPYADLKTFYSKSQFSLYKSKNKNKHSHIYQCANSLLDKVNKSSQNLLLIGESGSGKTEIFKRLLKYITDDCKISEKIRAGFFILQCFTMTENIESTRSSRCAIYSKVCFSQDRVVGGSFEGIGLDTSALWNFQIFQMLRCNKSNSLIAEYGKMEKWAIEDPIYAEKYLKIIQAFQIINIGDEANDILQMLAGILSISNIEFIIEKNKVNVTKNSYKYLQFASKFLMVAEEDLCSVFIPLQNTSKNDIEKITETRNSFAEALYHKVVNWICFAINSELNSESTENYIGILDLYGWESLKNNGLGQFWRNYANEKVHKFVMDSLFNQDTDVQVTYNDNFSVLEMIENKSDGVIKVINDFFLAGPGQGNLTQWLQKKHQGNEYFSSNLKENNVVIYHTAMPVLYNCELFRKGNIEEINNDIELCFLASRSRIIKQISVISNGIIKGVTLLKSMQELDLLLEDLKKGNCNFIYCMNSNDKRQSWGVNQRLILRQIQTISLVDFLALHKKTQKIKLTYEEFQIRYRSLLGEIQNSREIENFLKRLSGTALVNKEFVIVTKEMLGKLDRQYKKLCKILTKPIKILQNWFRNKSRHLKLKKLFHAILRVQALYRGKKDYVTYNTTKSKIKHIQVWYKSKFFAHKAKLEEQGLLIFHSHLKKKIAIYMQARYETLGNLLKPVWAHYKLKKFSENTIKIRSLFYVHIFNKSWIFITNKLQKKSATMIQKVFKGYFCRKNISTKLKALLLKFKKNHSATLIQKHVKSYLTHKNFSKIKSAAAKIKSFYISKSQLFHYQFTLKSVRLIQRRIRMFLLRVRQIKSKLSEFLIKEKGLLSNLTYLEHSTLFSSNLSLPNVQDARLRLLSSLVESNARLTKLELARSGSVSMQTRDVNPFHIEKLYFFSRVFDLEIFTDESVVYDPLWSTQLESLYNESIRKEENIMDIRVGACHSVALTNRGKIFAWGWNDKNQCGSPGKKARIIEKARDYRVVQIDCGDDHTIALTSDGEILTFGDNTKGQLGLGNYQATNMVYKLPILQCKQVCAMGWHNFVVTHLGELYTWPIETSQSVQSIPTRILSEIYIEEVSVGFDFTIVLASSGLLYSYGKNSEGQLGLGDYKDRTSFELVNYLKKIGEKIGGVSCGFNHCLAKTSLGKVFSWGSGKKGQLGHAGDSNENLPKCVNLKGKFKCVQVTAGYYSSVLIMENRKVFMSVEGGFQEIFVQDRLPEFVKGEEFALTRVVCTWSRMFNVIWIVLTDLRHLKTSRGKLQAGLNLLTEKWTRNIDPEVVEVLAGYYPTISCRKSPVRSSSIKN